MGLRARALLVLAVAVCAAPLGAQQFVSLPGWTHDVTPDGAVAVGWKSGGAFYWRWQVDPSPVSIGGLGAVAVSDDGTVITGNISDPIGGAQVAARWTAETGWVSLGGFDTCGSTSSAYDISGDGKQIVGLAWVGCSARGFRWTEGVGMELLQTLASGNNRCSTIASDGSVMGGFAQATFDRTPAVWAADTTGVVWDPSTLGEVQGMNNDGSVQLGTRAFVFYSTAFFNSASTGLVDLGSLQPTFASSSMAISEDGGTIVGFDWKGLARKAWIRQSPSHSLVALQDRLTALGIPGVPHLDTANACSDSGRTVVGGGGTLGYIATLQPEAWKRLAGGTAGVNGTPVLYGTGTLQGGSTATLTLTHGKPFGSATLIVGLSALNAPFKQGLLVPQPDKLLFGLPLDGDGRFHAEFTWPAGLPSGVSLWHQAWIADAAAPAGFASSNGLQSTAP
ncbi:MAG TPA: hypothetical protein VFD43_10600 [Planctomycetota bacterium]|nr:hypothetical protein [Planctomycetota bacterium]